MSDVLWAPLVALPVLLAALAGVLTSRSNMVTRVATLLSVTVYPLPHSYLLRFLRETFLNLNYKDKVVAGQLSALLMTAEFVICPLVFLVAFGIRRAMMQRRRALR